MAEAPSVIFLDVDGVLVPLCCRIDAVHATQPYGCPVALDRRLIWQFKSLLAATDASIVVCSPKADLWRVVHGACALSNVHRFIVVHSCLCCGKHACYSSAVKPLA